MKKLRRSARLIEITQYLLSRPHTIIPLTTFADRYNSAKSSISEDLTIIKEVFEGEEIGELVTHAGAAGGVRYIPQISKAYARSIIEKICQQLDHPEVNSRLPTMTPCEYGPIAFGAFSVDTV